MDTQLSLRERTVIIAGPFSSTVQNLMMGLAQLGADVVLLDKDAQGANRFCQNINDQREINDKHGRAIAIAADLSDRKKMREAVGQAAQTFGGLDIYIDAHLYNQPSPMSLTGDETDLETLLLPNLKIPLMLTQTIVPFLKGRRKGRILYLINQSNLNGQYNDLFAAAGRSGLVAFAKALSRQVSDQGLTVNLLALGLTEEYVLAQHALATGAMPTIREVIDQMKKTDPHVRITEPDKITSSVAYIVSSFGVAVNGQLIQLS